MSEYEPAKIYSVGQKLFVERREGWWTRLLLALRLRRRRRYQMIGVVTSVTAPARPVEIVVKPES